MNLKNPYRFKNYHLPPIAFETYHPQDCQRILEAMTRIAQEQD